jgi:hypothetical protein
LWITPRPTAREGFGPLPMADWPKVITTSDYANRRSDQLGCSA